MSVFQTYLELGFNHITDLKGYDHILFIFSLCVIYNIKQWKKILILITAFTIGHSITLALATLNLIHIKNDLVEFLIPLTIFITAFGNYFQKSDKFNSPFHKLKYGFALFFGLIHGLGFSNFLRAILGNEESLIEPLLAFNIGVEIGQLGIVLVLLILTLVFTQILNVKNREWNLILSGASLGISAMLIFDRWPF